MGDSGVDPQKYLNDYKMLDLRVSVLEEEREESRDSLKSIGSSISAKQEAL